VFVRVIEDLRDQCAGKSSMNGFKIISKAVFLIS
jgi:hypothetical protein